MQLISIKKDAINCSIFFEHSTAPTVNKSYPICGHLSTSFLVLVLDVYDRIGFSQQKLLDRGRSYPLSQNVQITTMVKMHETQN
mgnify:FL=1